MPAPETEDPELSALIRSRATRYTAPPALRAAVWSALGDGAPAARPVRWFERLWPRLTAAFACGALAAAVVLQISGPMLAQAGDPFAEQVVDGHLRSLLVDHLMDVASTDQHTVKPWFAGKLDFTPPVPDFAAEGYPLQGGRLDMLGGRPVAAIVYGHRQHHINVFVLRQADTGSHDAPAQTRRGFHLLNWSREGLDYWVVSDLNAQELAGFAALYRQHAD
jgi:anti-sigma factor RsiW